MRSRIVIFGGGTQLPILVDIIEKCNLYQIVGIVDSYLLTGRKVLGYPVLGKQENILSIVKEYDIAGGIISVGDNYSRNAIYNSVTTLLRDTPFNWVNAIHPSVIIGKGISIGHGIVAMANVVFNPNCVIEDFTAFYTGAIIEHDCHIKRFASVSAGSVIAGKTIVGRRSAITLNCTLVDRIEIGNDTVIGSGSLVLNNIPDNVLAYGSPCKVIRERQDNEKFLK